MDEREVLEIIEEAAKDGRKEFDLSYNGIELSGFTSFSIMLNVEP